MKLKKGFQTVQGQKPKCQKKKKRREMDGVKGRGQGSNSYDLTNSTYTGQKFTHKLLYSTVCIYTYKLSPLKNERGECYARASFMNTHHSASYPN